jgi:hypothetical protein
MIVIERSNSDALRAAFSERSLDRHIMIEIVSPAAPQRRPFLLRAIRKSQRRLLDDAPRTSRDHWDTGGLHIRGLGVLIHEVILP